MNFMIARQILIFLRNVEWNVHKYWYKYFLWNSYPTRKHVTKTKKSWNSYKFPYVSKPHQNKCHSFQTNRILYKIWFTNTLCFNIESKNILESSSNSFIGNHKFHSLGNFIARMYYVLRHRNEMLKFLIVNCIIRIHLHKRKEHPPIFHM